MPPLDDTIQRAMRTAAQVRAAPPMMPAVEPGAVEPDEAEDPNRGAARLTDVIKRGEPIQPKTPRPTAQQIAAAKADTRKDANIVSRRLDTIVPEHERVHGGTYTPGAPNGGRWADAMVTKDVRDPGGDDIKIRDPHEMHDRQVHEKLVDQPGHGFNKIKDEDLQRIWHESVAQSSAAAKEAVKTHRVAPKFDAKDWHEAMSLPLRDHLWYELSGEKMAENLPDLTPKEHMRMLDILGATSARAKPDENLERTLGVLSQHMRGAPADVDLTIPSSVRQALSRSGHDTSALPGNKTGHFSDTLALTGGVPSRFPISVNDVWVGKMFDVPDNVMSLNQSLHEPMAHYFNKIRDLYNERHGHETYFPYQSWNFQAPAWVHLRQKESGAKGGDAYHQVWGKTVQKLRDAGVPGLQGDKITREALMHPSFADAIRRKTKAFRDAPKATIELGSTQNKGGKKGLEAYKAAQAAGEHVGQHEYTKALTSAMYGSARGKGHPWDRLKKAITGDISQKSDITRIAYPTSGSPHDIGGTFQGNVSPNIRIPLQGMDEDQLAMFNGIAGRHLKQDAMAISHVLGAEHGSEPREGHTRGHSLFVPTTEQIHPDDIRAFAKELAPHGHDMSYQRHPNGYQFDILPAFGDKGPVGVSEETLDKAYENSLHGRYGKAKITPHDFKSVYTEAGDYGKLRTKLTNRIRDDFFDQAAEHGHSRAEALAALKDAGAPLSSGGKKARDVYRARIGHLAASEQALKGIAAQVEQAHAKFAAREPARLEKLAKRKPDPEAAPFARGGAVEPTDAQKEAGNYKKDHVDYLGLPISIENRKGSTRTGTDANGKPWSAEMPADYGYIKRTEGADGDHVDVYIGPHKDSRQVFIVNQRDHHTGKFDEHKIILGTHSEHEARELYCAGFSDGHGMARMGSLEPISLDALKVWLKHRKTDEPLKTSELVKHALSKPAPKPAGDQLGEKEKEVLDRALGLAQGYVNGKAKEEAEEKPREKSKSKSFMEEAEPLLSAIKELVEALYAPQDVVKDEKTKRIVSLERRRPKRDASAANDE